MKKKRILKDNGMDEKIMKGFDDDESFIYYETLIFVHQVLQSSNIQ